MYSRDFSFNLSEAEIGELTLPNNHERLFKLALLREHFSAFSAAQNAMPEGTAEDDSAGKLLMHSWVQNVLHTIPARQLNSSLPFCSLSRSATESFFIGATVLTGDASFLLPIGPAFLDCDAKLLLNLPTLETFSAPAAVIGRTAVTTEGTALGFFQSLSEDAFEESLARARRMQFETDDPGFLREQSTASIIYNLASECAIANLEVEEKPRIHDIAGFEIGASYLDGCEVAVVVRTALAGEGLGSLVLGRMEERRFELRIERSITGQLIAAPSS